MRPGHSEARTALRNERPTGFFFRWLSLSKPALIQFPLRHPSAPFDSSGALKMHFIYDVYYCQIRYSLNRSGNSTSQSGLAFLTLRSNSPRSILFKGGSARRGGEKYGRSGSDSGRNISSQWLGMTKRGWTLSIKRAYQRSPETARQMSTSAASAFSVPMLLHTRMRLPWKEIRKLRQESMR